MTTLSHCFKASLRQTTWLPGIRPHFLDVSSFPTRKYRVISDEPWPQSAYKDIFRFLKLAFFVRHFRRSSVILVEFNV